jgi:hypothetical protein
MFFIFFKFFNSFLQLQMGTCTDVNSKIHKFVCLHAPKEFSKGDWA